MFVRDNSRCNNTNNNNLSATDCHGAMIAISRGLKSSEATFELNLEATEPPSALFTQLFTQVKIHIDLHARTAPCPLSCQKGQGVS